MLYLLYKTKLSATAEAKYCIEVLTLFVKVLYSATDKKSVLFSYTRYDTYDTVFRWYEVIFRP